MVDALGVFLCFSRRFAKVGLKAREARGDFDNELADRSHLALAGCGSSRSLLVIADRRQLCNESFHVLHSDNFDDDRERGPIGRLAPLGSDPLALA